MQKMTSLEDVFSKREECNKTTYAIINEQTYKKKLKVCGKLGDLGLIGKKIIISSCGMVVRKIEVKDNGVLIDACDGSKPILFSKDEIVYFEEWFLDRGSYLIWCDFINCLGKLATQYDEVKST